MNALITGKKKKRGWKKESGFRPNSAYIKQATEEFLNEGGMIESLNETANTGGRIPAFETFMRGGNVPEIF